MQPILSRQPLVADRRGVIVLFAVFAACFLVGLIWYVIGIGDAIVHRQTMQDAADAAVYASAVVHARGMNIIAFINLLMALVLAVLVTLKLIETAFLLVLMFPAALAVQRMATTYQNTAMRTTLPALNALATWTARITPWAGSAASVLVAKAYGKWGVSASVSLLPLGRVRDGLPVTDESFTILCRAAGKMIGQMVLEPLRSGLGVPTGWIQDQLPDLIAIFPGWFCGGWEATFQQLDGSYSPKKVYPPAVCGNDYFAVWSFVDDTPPTSTADQMIQVASWGTPVPRSQSLWSNVGFAKAEFYFDRGMGEFSFGQSANGPERPQVENSPDAPPGGVDVMWNMRWRARLRRFRPPIVPIGSMLGEALNSSFFQTAERWFNSNGRGGMPWPAYQLFNQVKRIVRQLGFLGDSYMKDRYGLPWDAKSGVIH